jgi:hypothetical protein
MELEELLSDEEDEVDERFRNNYESGLEMVRAVTNLWVRLSQTCSSYMRD